MMMFAPTRKAKRNPQDQNVLVMSIARGQQPPYLCVFRCASACSMAWHANEEEHPIQKWLVSKYLLHFKNVAEIALQIYLLTMGCAFGVAWNVFLVAIIMFAFLLLFIVACSDQIHFALHDGDTGML